MKKQFAKLFGLYGAFCFGLFGITHLSPTGNEPDMFHVIFEMVAMGITAILLMIPFIKTIRDMLRLWAEETSESSYIRALRAKTVQYATVIKEDIFAIGHIVVDNLNEQENLISRFRADYNDFFLNQGEGVRENTPLQNTATQLYWNVLSLQKRRLDKAGLTMSLEAKRMTYGNRPNVSAGENQSAVNGDVVYDGKYEVSELSEMINAQRTFFRNHRRIARFKSKEVARYHMLNAKKIGSDKIICPGCGHTSTRENLLDGCDYCNTKFVVEDLGMRVSEFGLYPDPDVEYKKYKEFRSKYTMRVALITGIPIFIYTLWETIPQVLNSPTRGTFLQDLGPFLFFVTARALFLIAVVVAIATITIIPILQAKASLTYYGKKALTKMKVAETQNQQVQDYIRSYDPLFSLGELYANIQNKLATFHYADNVLGMEAVTEGDKILQELNQLPGKYQQVVNMDLASVTLNNYQLSNGMQEVDVTAQLILMKQKGNSIKTSKERVHLKMVKNAACVTKSVCAPAVTTCRSCGASHSISDGRTCRYCGYQRKLSDFDWAVTEYIPK